VQVVVAEVADVEIAPVLLAQETSKQPSVLADFASFLEPARHIKAAYLPMVISYIKSPRNTVEELVWQIKNWHTEKMQRVMPRNIYKDLSCFIEALQKLPQSELIRGINLIKTSSKSSRVLAKVLYTDR